MSRPGAARPDGRLAVSGHVEAWPEGFLAALPAADWQAVMFRPRQDKLLVNALRSTGIPGIAFYERRLRRRRGGGPTEHLVPLLGSWLFAHGADRDALWETGRVARVVAVTDGARLVAELGDLIAMLARASGPIRLRPELVPGMRVRLASGALAGLHGIIQRRRGAARLIVNLVTLGSSVSIELPAEAAEPAP